jgi:hypothetical protein
MSKLSGPSKRIALLLLTLAIVISVNLSPVVSAINQSAEDSNESPDNEVNQERRTNGLDKLRYFLLTSNPKERAAKREQQNSYKRELVRIRFFKIKKNLV